MKTFFKGQNRKEIWTKLRESGILFAIIVWSTYCKIPVPVNAMQGKASFGFTEIIILLLGIYEFIMLCRRRYIPTAFAKKVFIVVVVAGTVSLVICGIHVVLHGKSLFEFVGVLRNLYACTLIFFAADAGILDKEEILNGLVLLVFVSEIIALVVTIANDILEMYLPEILADHRFVAVAGVALIPYAVLKGKNSKLLYVQWGLMISNVMLGGRRTETALTFVLMALMYFCMWLKKNREIIRLFVRANILGLVLTIFLSIVLICGFGSNMTKIHLCRSVPGLVWIFEKADIQVDHHIKEAMQLGIESGERSNSIRSVIWSAFGEKIRKSPLIGTGERTIRINMKTASEMLGGFSVGYDDGKEQVMVAHNFIIEIMSVEGLFGFLAYAGLMLYLYGNVLLRLKVSWIEKVCVFVFTGTFYIFALVQPAITGGITSNIYVWSFLGYTFADNRNREKLKEHSGNGNG